MQLSSFKRFAHQANPLSADPTLIDFIAEQPQSVAATNAFILKELQNLPKSLSQSSSTLSASSSTTIESGVNQLMTLGLPQAHLIASSEQAKSETTVMNTAGTK